MDRTWTNRNDDHGQAGNPPSDDLERRVEHRTYELQEMHRHTLQVEKLRALSRFSASVAQDISDQVPAGFFALLHRREATAVQGLRTWISDQNALDPSLVQRWVGPSKSSGCPLQLSKVHSPW